MSTFAWIILVVVALPIWLPAIVYVFVFWAMLPTWILDWAWRRRTPRQDAML